MFRIFYLSQRQGEYVTFNYRRKESKGRCISPLTEGSLSRLEAFYKRSPKLRDGMERFLKDLHACGLELTSRLELGTTRCL